jgi:hypothetical protein
VNPYREPHVPWAPKDEERVEILANDWSITNQWAGRVGVAKLRGGHQYTVTLDDGYTLYCHLRELAPVIASDCGAGSPSSPESA